jgi:hypothetical protein
MEIEELYLYSLSGPSWPVLRRTLRLPNVTGNISAFVYISDAFWVEILDLRTAVTSFVVFPNPSRIIPGHDLKIGHGPFLHYSSDHP